MTDTIDKEKQAKTGAGDWRMNDLSLKEWKNTSNIQRCPLCFICCLYLILGPRAGNTNWSPDTTLGFAKKIIPLVA